MICGGLYRFRRSSSLVFVFCLILNLPRSNVTDELGTLDGITGTLESLLCHTRNMARLILCFILCQESA